MLLGTVSLVIPFPQKGNGILLLCGFIFAIIIPFPQKGNGILLLCGFILAIIIIPFPQKGNGILLLCGFILAIIIIIGVVVVKLVRFHSSIEAISMKLGGHIGHGPNSSYHHF